MFHKSKDSKALPNPSGAASNLPALPKLPATVRLPGVHSAPNSPERNGKKSVLSRPASAPLRTSVLPTEDEIGRYLATHRASLPSEKTGHGNNGQLRRYSGSAEELAYSDSESDSDIESKLSLLTRADKESMANKLRSIIYAPQPSDQNSPRASELAPKNSPRAPEPVARNSPRRHESVSATVITSTAASAETKVNSQALHSVENSPMDGSASPTASKNFSQRLCSFFCCGRARDKEPRDVQKLSSR